MAICPVFRANTMYNIYLPATAVSPTDEQRRDLRTFLKKRRITYLTHFTRIENVRSILRYGILPRSVVRGNKALSSAKLSDHGLPDAWARLVPFNLSLPDYKLFTEIEGTDLSKCVVLLIDAKVLCDYPFYFFPDHSENFIHNAPFPNMVLTEGLSIKEFKALFNDLDDVKRNALDLESFYPTSPRTELLSFFPIPPSYIAQICFTSEYKFNQWFLHNTELALNLDKKNFWACGLQYFSPRSDSNAWKTRGICSAKTSGHGL